MRGAQHLAGRGQLVGMAAGLHGVLLPELRAQDEPFNAGGLARARGTSALSAVCQPCVGSVRANRRALYGYAGLTTQEIYEWLVYSR